MQPLAVIGLLGLAITVIVILHRFVDKQSNIMAVKKFDRWKKEGDEEHQRRMALLDAEYRAMQQKCASEYELKRRAADDYSAGKIREADLYYHDKKRQVDSYMDLLEDLKRQIGQSKFSSRWIASQYEKLMDRTLEFITFRTQYRSEKTAEVLATQRKLRKEAERKARFFELLLSYYENLFPWLQDYRDEDDDLVIGQYDDPVSGGDVRDDDESSYWLSPEEWARLSSVERNQLALDRYVKSRNRSPHEIGRDYEAFIGYGYESQGYQVTYHGMLMGVEDLGRDLICTKNGVRLVVQCKCWSAARVIREKHINQLFGTMVEYAIRNHCVLDGCLGRLQSIEDLTKTKVKGVFVTSTLLSEEARCFADVLGIEILQGLVPGNYPRIKCNVNPDRNTKIYHLPFDQQYERIAINRSEGDFYAFTVLEAENGGFVRAKRHFAD